MAAVTAVRDVAAAADDDYYRDGDAKNVSTNYEGCSENTAYYFILLANEVRGKCWRYKHSG